MEKALQLALEALEKISMGGDPRRADLAITAIKAALEAPQRAWVALDEEDYIKAYELCDFDKDAAFEFFEAALKAKNT